MNFYIGNAIEDIDVNEGENVEFSDDFLDLIYKLRKKVSIDMSKLYKINPYRDVIISKKDLFEIIKICKYILNASLLENDIELEERKQMLKELIAIAQKAIARDLGLISIGD